MRRTASQDESGGGRPAGVPLGRAFIIRPGVANDDLREAVAAVSRVHGDGVLPTIPMLLSTSVTSAGGRPADGHFRVRVAKDRTIIPVSIQLRSEATHRQFVALHEIGHFLDASGLPGKSYSSESDSALGGWQQAVVQSRAHYELESLASSGDPAVSARAAVRLSAGELWARSYAQFVVVRDGSAALWASLDAFRRREREDLYFPRQWDDDDFAAIASAIDELFGRLGWVA
jgi:hypothetical protein